jgi:hypothetical protein
MTKGNELATYSMKSTSATFLPGPAGSTITQVNFEGTATGGYGTVAGTGSFVGGAKGGSMSWCGVAYLENGDQLTSAGSGSYESTGTHHWRTESVIHLSDGSAMLSEGEIDLADRSWNGKVYNWN